MSKILISITPEYVDKIFAGTKKFEYRKTRCNPDVDTMIVYSTYPKKRVVGEVKIVEIIEDLPDLVWEKTKVDSGITKVFFDSYYKGKNRAIAYKLGEIKKYNPVKLLKDFGVKNAPQSFVYIK